MQESTFTLMGNEGTRVHVYCWLPDPDEHIQGVVQIAHGMGETAARYAEFAGYLTKHGFAVYANDHRGHGRTVESTEALGDAGVDAFRWMAKDMVNLGELVAKEHPDVPLFLMGHSMGSFWYSTSCMRDMRDTTRLCCPVQTANEACFGLEKNWLYSSAAFKVTIIEACY